MEKGLNFHNEVGLVVVMARWCDGHGDGGREER